MDELKDLYFRIENPMDDRAKWNKLLNIYSTSRDYEDFYTQVTNKDKVKEEIYYDVEDKKTFCLVMWSIWKKKILSIPEEELRTLIEEKEYDYDIYDVIKSVRELDSIKTYTELEQVLTDSKINKYFSDLFDDFNHKVIIYSDLNVKKNVTYNTVLSVNIDASKLYKILKTYINECISQELPYYIKYNEYGEKISVSFYTTIENFRKNETILNILKKENYTYFFDDMDLLSGRINDLISIRSKDYYNTYQYLRERSLIFFKSVDSVIYDYIMRHMNILVSYKDGRMNVLDYLCTYITEKEVDKLVDKSVKTKKEFFMLANSEDLFRLRNYVKEKLSLNIKEILNQRLFLKPGDEEITLKLNENHSINIKVSTIMSGMRNLTQTLILKDRAIEKAFRIRIKNECQFFKIDYDKFCLDAGFSKKLFYDKEKSETYQQEIDKIHSEIKKVAHLETLMASDKTEENRNLISDSLSELREIFNLEEGN